MSSVPQLKWLFLCYSIDIHLFNLSETYFGVNCLRGFKSKITDQIGKEGDKMDLESGKFTEVKEKI